MMKMKMIKVLSMTTIFGAALMFTGISGTSYAQTTSATKDATIHTRNHLKRLLLSDRISVDFRNAPAEDVFDYLRVISGHNFWVHWRALEEVDITRDTRIDLKLRNVELRQVYLKVMSSLESDGARLAIHVDDNLTEITTLEYMNRRQVVRVYSIADLVRTPPRFDNAPEMNINTSVSETGSDTLFGGSSGDVEVIPEEEQAQQLIELIQSLVSPEIWEDNGGTAGSIRYYQGMLVVRAPFYIQKEIGVRPVPSANLERRGWQMPR